MVLVDEAAENVSPMDIFGASCRWEGERRVRGSQIEPAMWSVGVVVLHVGVQDAIEMPTAQDERPIKELSSHRSHPSLSEGVGRSRLVRAFGDRTGVRTTFAPSVLNTSSKERGNF